MQHINGSRAQLRAHRRSLLGSAMGLWLLACGGGSSEPPASVAVDAGADAGGRAPDAGAPIEPPVAQAVCSSDGWCWDGFGPHGNALNAVAAVSATELWVVGALGLGLHYDGSRWSAHWAPTRATLRGVWARGDEVWAVGDDATLLQLVSGQWQAVSVPGLASDVDLRGVYGDGEGGLWAVGTAGTLLERRGGAWQRAESGVTVALNAVWADEDAAWAVGDAGTLLRLASGTWQRVQSDTGQNLLAVHGSGDDVWFAGASGELRHYDFESERWERPSGEGPAPEGELRAVQVLGDGRVYAAGALGEVYTWDGAATCPVPGDAGAPEEPCPKWAAARSTGLELPIAGLWASGERAIAVGAHGSIVRWDGAARTLLGGAGLDNYLDVHGSSASDVWLAGDRVLQRREGGWTELVRDSERAAYALSVPAVGQLLVAGTGGMTRRYAEERWSSLDVRPDAWLHGLWSDGTSGWLVGSRGSAWGLLNGRLWTPLDTPTDRDLLAVWGAPSGSAWAVGAGGVTLRHDGVAWASIPSGPSGGVSADLRGVWGSADDDIWAVGTGGTTLHWDGLAWARHGEPATYSLNDVWGRSASDIWAVGSQGTILHYDGVSWQQELSGTDQALNAVWGSDGQLWVVGEHGTVLLKALPL